MAQRPCTKTRIGFYGLGLSLLIVAGLVVLTGRRPPSPVPTQRPAPASIAATAEPPRQEPAEKAGAGEESTAPSAEQPKAWIEHTIRKGDTLAGIFDQYDLGSGALRNLLNSDKHLKKELTRLYPGKTVKFLLDDKGGLEKIVYERSTTESIAASRADEGFDIEKVFRQTEKELHRASGTVESSLFIAGKKAGLSDSIIMQLTEIFGWDIDFSRSIRPGDSFNVFYEKQYLDGKFIGDGDIVAAEFINQGKIHQALRFILPDGTAEYYTPEGKTLKKAFLRMPVKSARITSRFNLHRRHPILHRIRAHKGVDYAAPIGTPVRATGDGKIVFRGRKGGYGRVIIIQHGRRYSTLYAHLHRFNARFKLGARVKQGDVIAYVGKSGLASGPHLHYEFRINGVHRDPLTVPLPESKPIPKSLLTEFREQTAPLLAELERTRPTALARRETAGE